MVIFDKRFVTGLNIELDKFDLIIQPWKAERRHLSSIRVGWRNLFPEMLFLMVSTYQDKHEETCWYAANFHFDIIWQHVEDFDFAAYTLLQPTSSRTSLTILLSATTTATPATTSGPNTPRHNMSQHAGRPCLEGVYLTNWTTSLFMEPRRHLGTLQVIHYNYREMWSDLCKIRSQLEFR